MVSIAAIRGGLIPVVAGTPALLCPLLRAARQSPHLLLLQHDHRHQEGRQESRQEINRETAGQSECWLSERQQETDCLHAQ